MPERFYIFDKLNTSDVTLLGFKLITAIEEDYRNQKGTRFKVDPYGKKIHNVIKLGNAQAFKRLKTIGKKLATGTPLGVGDSLVKGSDLAKIISYVATMDFNHYPTFEEVLKQEGGKYWGLYQQVAKEDFNPLKDFAHIALNNVNTSSPTLSIKLIEIAKELDRLERNHYEMSRTIEAQNLSIVEKTTKNKELVALLSDIKKHFKTLEAKIAKARDPKRKQELIESFNKFKKQFEQAKI